MKNAIMFITLSCLLLVIPAVSQIPATAPNSDVCYRWQTQVDPALSRVVIDKSGLTPSQIEVGIECLLKLKGKTAMSRFSGATRNNYYKSDQFRPPKRPASIEVAALYYISYLFYDNWEHASAISLFDEESKKVNSNTKKSIERAYASYLKWFEKLKLIGLEEARRQKIDPLSGSGISWQ